MRLGIAAHLAREGAQVVLATEGGLTWPGAGAADTYRDHLQHMQAIGYDAHWLAPGEVASWTPGVDATAVASEGAIFTPGEGWVDLPWLIDLLAERLRSYGGRVVENAGPVQLTVDDGRATGVTAGNDVRVDSDAVVLATGAAVPTTLAAHGVAIPDATSVALLVTTQPVQHSLRAVTPSPIPRSGTCWTRPRQYWPNILS